MTASTRSGYSGRLWSPSARSAPSVPYAGICLTRPVKEIDEHVKGGDTWVVKLETKGQSDFFYQDLVVGPGGRTGWHSHPGLLMITIKEGSVDFYDNKCTKHSYTAGQAFTEGSEPHNALNSGSGNAHLLVFYVIKKGESRRLENAQPPCAVSLGIP